MFAAAPTTVIVHPARRVEGQVRVPGDKSISHRYAMLAALSDGTCRIDNYSAGADCQSTLQCLAQLGVAVTKTSADASSGQRTTSAAGTVRIDGRGLRGLRAASGALDAGNSGSTMRMMAGILAAHPFETTMVGDASLSRRPMRRVMVPLAQMGATLTAADFRPPLTVRGTDLHGIEYTPDIPSAQVKSAVLLAGLQASGTTTVRETAATRDHTERAFRAFGVQVDQSGLAVTVAGGQPLRALDLLVPGDMSSAAFWACAAAALPGSDVEIVDVGLNPTRTPLIDVLRRAGATVDVTLDADGRAGEPMGRLRIRHGAPRPLVIAPDEVPGLIDELPVLAALATFGGEITVTGAAELRGKESDRITALVAGLNAIGSRADELPDGFHIVGSQPLDGGRVEACGDHRLAMAFAIAALGARGPVEITGAEAVDVSYPGFFSVLQHLSQ